MPKFWRSAAECLAVSLVLVALCFISYELHFNLTTASLLYVIAVVLISRFGNYASSITASFVAAVCLAHLAPPAFSFRINDPLDVVAVITFFLASLTIAALVSRVRKQTYDALSSVNYRVIEAEEQERRRIATDLHEDVGQRLSLLAIEIEQLNAASPNTVVDVPGRTETVLKQVLEILRDVKTLAHELYSPRLEYLGIAEVMSSFCSDFGKRRGIAIDFSSDSVPSRIPPDVTLCLFRVLQEALKNAAQYSGVRHFDARLWGTIGQVHLTVSDCGVGFSVEKAGKFGGLGLNRMHERLKLVGGTLSIESQPHRGTTIHARVPVSPGTDSISAVGKVNESVVI